MTGARQAPPARRLPHFNNPMLCQLPSVEDIYEAIVNTVPQMKFGVASGPCLIRVDGNDDALKALAAANAAAISAGHIFVVVMTERGTASTSSAASRPSPRSARFPARRPIRCRL